MAEEESSGNRMAEESEEQDAEANRFVFSPWFFVVSNSPSPWKI